MSKDPKKAGKETKSGIKLETTQQSNAYSELVKVVNFIFRNSIKF